MPFSWGISRLAINPMARLSQLRTSAPGEAGAARKRLRPGRADYGHHRDARALGPGSTAGHQRLEDAGLAVIFYGLVRTAMS